VGGVSLYGHDIIEHPDYPSHHVADWTTNHIRSMWVILE